MSQHKALDMFGRSGNPALNAETFTREKPEVVVREEYNRLHLK